MSTITFGFGLVGAAPPERRPPAGRPMSPALGLALVASAIMWVAIFAVVAAVV
jgi:hypothetical protein